MAVAWAAATAAGSGGCSSVCTSPLKGQLASKIYSYQGSIAQILLESLHTMQYLRIEHKGCTLHVAQIEIQMRGKSMQLCSELTATLVRKKDPSMGILIWTFDSQLNCMVVVMRRCACALTSATAGFSTLAGAAPLLPLPAFDLASSMSSAVSAMKAMGSPTLATPPSGMTIAPRMPSLKDSTSMSALSDSTTTTDSPFDTLSPGPLSQDTILPSVIVELRAGMKISLTALEVCRLLLGTRLLAGLSTRAGIAPLNAQDRMSTAPLRADMVTTF